MNPVQATCWRSPPSTSSSTPVAGRLRRSRWSGSGKPIFVRHRTDGRRSSRGAATCRSVRAERTPSTDADRVKAGQGPVARGRSASARISAASRSATSRPIMRGEFGGWFCPCHGSQYDTAGRVRHGPAPRQFAAAALRLHRRHARSRSADPRAHAATPPPSRSQEPSGNPSWPALHKSDFKPTPCINWVDTRLPGVHPDGERNTASSRRRKQLQLFLEFRRSRHDQPGHGHDRRRACSWR